MRIVASRLKTRNDFLKSFRDAILVLYDEKMRHAIRPKNFQRADLSPKERVAVLVVYKVVSAKDARLLKVYLNSFSSKTT